MKLSDEELLQGLVDRKILQPRQVRKAVDLKRKTGDSWEKILQDLGIEKTQILNSIAEMSGTPSINLEESVLDPEAALLVPEIMAKRYRLICTEKVGRSLILAMADPSDVFAQEYVRMRTGYDVIPKLALGDDVDRAILALYAAPVTRSGQGHVLFAEEQRPEVRTIAVDRPATVVSFPRMALSPSQAAQDAAVIEDNRKLATLCQFSTELAAIEDVEQLFLRTIEMAAAITNAEASSFLLYDEPHQLLYFKAVKGEKEDLLKRITIPMAARSIAGWVAMYRKPAIVNDVTKDPRHFRKVDEMIKFRTRSVAAVPVMGEGKLLGVLEAINKAGPDDFEVKDQEYLSILAGNVAVALQKCESLSRLRNFFLHSVEILITAIEALEPLVKGHIIRVARLATQIAMEMGIEGKELEDLCYAALMHDIGKLSQEARSMADIVKRHPVLGAEMIKEVRLLAPIVPLIRCHHERYDGSGFPEGLKGENIPLGARVLALAEAYEEWQDGGEGKKLPELFFQEQGKSHDPKAIKALRRVLQFPAGGK
ncbi:MAG: GAF domain-containing protein [Armatimonadetes bacterium]|nr:GAF domain-containing protein [Armatimonadota bacterium]